MNALWEYANHVVVLACVIYCAIRIGNGIADRIEGWRR